MSEQYSIEVDYKNAFDEATVRITYCYETKYVYPLDVISLEQCVVLLDGSSVWITIPDKNHTMQENIVAMWEDEMISEVPKSEPSYPDERRDVQPSKLEDMK